MFAPLNIKNKFAKNNKKTKGGILIKNSIKSVNAIEIIDSRGNPTVRAFVTLENGIVGSASVPSGASTGEYEAVELRDNEPSRYKGKGVEKAVRNIKTVISLAISGRDVLNQSEIDRKILEIDGTPDKSRLGANAILAVSLAAAKTASILVNQPLFRYLGGINGTKIPTPMMNILNGGAHSPNKLDFQEFMILPVGFNSFSEKVRAGSEIYKTLGEILKKRGLATAVGDEGGYAPEISEAEEALDLISEAVEKAGYNTEKVKLALDVASSEWKGEKGYFLPKSKKSYTSEEIISHIETLIKKYPIISVEDGLGENDWYGWKILTEKLGNKTMLVGDDLFVTDTERLKTGIAQKCGNAILIKPNQIGTLTETLDVINLAHKNGYKTVISHRSGETGDTFISDLAVAVNSPFIKAGAPSRSERCEKYNRLIEIEQILDCPKKFTVL